MKKRFEPGDKVYCLAPTQWMRDHGIIVGITYIISEVTYPHSWTDAEATLKLAGIEYVWPLDRFIVATPRAPEKGK